MGFASLGTIALALVAAAPAANAQATAAEPAAVSGIWLSADQLAAQLGDPSLAEFDASDTGALARLQAAAVKHGASPATREQVRQAAATVPGPKVNVIPGDPGSTPWYTIQLDMTDWAGNETLVRTGDYSHFGYLKGLAVHNMANLNAYVSAFSGFPKGVNSEGNTQYITAYVVNGYPEVQINVAVSPNYGSVYGNTPDYRSVGAVTAYCLGYEYCPDYIN